MSIKSLNGLMTASNSYFIVNFMFCLFKLLFVHNKSIIRQRVAIETFANNP